MIHMEEMRQLLCRTYPALHDRVAMTAGEWGGQSGEFIATAWMSQLSTLVQQRFLEGDYEQSPAHFLLVEQLLNEGDNSVQSAIATGFLEGLQHQQQLAPELWLPLLGSSAQIHCTAMNTFHGIDTEPPARGESFPVISVR